MTHLDLFIIAIALSCDAFAASITCGIKLKTLELKKYLKISGSFGLFQAVMPLLGFYLASFTIKDALLPFSKWIQASVFLFLGIKALKEAYEMRGNQSTVASCKCDTKGCLLTLSIATSIDALLIGLVLSLFPTSIFISSSVIGVVTFAVCLGACFVGHYSTSLLKKWSPIFASLLLLALALKAVLQ